MSSGCCQIMSINSMDLFCLPTSKRECSCLGLVADGEGCFFDTQHFRKSDTTHPDRVLVREPDIFKNTGLSCSHGIDDLQHFQNRQLPTQQKHP